MFKSLPCFTLICDNCGDDLYEDTDYLGFSDLDLIWEDAAENQGWLVIDGLHICGKCYLYDDNDEPVIKVNRQATDKEVLDVLRNIKSTKEKE